MIKVNTAYPLTKDGNPSNELIQTISEYLSGEKIRPLTDNVIVHSPEKVDFSIDAVLTLYLYADLNTVQELVNNRLNEYKNVMASKLGKDIVPSQIIEILSSIYGVCKVDLQIPQYMALSKRQWANLKNINITYGGRVNE